MLHQIASNIWEIARPIRNTKFNIGTRMTIVRLADGGLWIHSPVKFDQPLKAAVDSLGEVKFIVAPNQYHHLFVTPWIEAYPNAAFCCVSALLKKRPELKPTLVLDQTDVQQLPWQDSLKTCIVRGSKMFTEADFLHIPSRTLIITDFAFNIPPQPSVFFNLFLKIWGVYDRFSPSRLLRAFCRDREEVRRCYHVMAAWDFDRIVLAHGSIVTSGGKQKFQTAFAWLL